MATLYIYMCTKIATALGELWGKKRGISSGHSVMGLPHLKCWHVSGFFVAVDNWWQTTKTVYTEEWEHLCVLWEDARNSGRQQEVRQRQEKRWEGQRRIQVCFCSLFCPCFEHRAHPRAGGKKCLLNHKPTDHQKRAPKATGSNSENVERVFTPHGAGRGNILRHPGCEGWGRGRGL